jgi:ABC-type antimicrobial peptide transport system permease subunit
MVLKGTLILLLVGLAAGIPVILAGGRFLAALLYELKPADPTTLVMAALLLCAVAGLAGYIPARRAARIEPMEALRLD